MDVISGNQGDLQGNDENAMSGSRQGDRGNGKKVNVFSNRGDQGNRDDVDFCSESEEEPTESLNGDLLNLTSMIRNNKSTPQDFH